MRIKDLSKSQLSARLDSRDCMSGGKGFGSGTLEEIIESSGLSNEATVTELHEILDRCGVKSPFRELSVTVEVTRSRGYMIAVTDEQYACFQSGDLDIDALEPTRFNLEEAYFETEFGDDVYSRQDYAVSDEEGRNLVDWSK